MDACRGIDANLGCESEAERAGRASAGSCARPASGPSSPSRCSSRLDVGAMSSIQGAFDELDASARDAGGEDHCGVGGSARSDAVAGTPIAQEKTTSSWLRSRVRSGVTSNASAASTTSHRPSRGPSSSAPRASICERFFFEELRTCLGEEQAIQWLLMSQLSTTLTDEHRSPPPGTMRRSVTLGNLQAGEKAAAHATVVVMHGKRDLPPLIGQAGGGVCRGAGDVVSVSSLARARARVKDADSVGLMFTDAAHLVLGPRTPSE